MMLNKYVKKINYLIDLRRLINVQKRSFHTSFLKTSVTKNIHNSKRICAQSLLPKIILELIRNYKFLFRNHRLRKTRGMRKSRPTFHFHIFSREEVPFYPALEPFYGFCRQRFRYSRRRFVHFKFPTRAKGETAYLVGH